MEQISVQTKTRIELIDITSEVRKVVKIDIPTPREMLMLISNQPWSVVRRLE